MFFSGITNQYEEINYWLWEPHDVYIDMNHIIMEYAKLKSSIPVYETILWSPSNKTSFRANLVENIVKQTLF